VKAKQLGIGFRMAMGFVLIILMTVVISAVALMQMGSLADYTTKLYIHAYTVGTAMQRIDSNIVRIHRMMMEIALAEERAEIDKALASIDGYERRVLDDFAMVEDLFLGDKTKILEAKETFVGWKRVRDIAISLKRHGDSMATASVTTGRGAAYVESLYQSIHEVITLAQGEASQFLNHAIMARRQTMVITLVLVGLALASGAFFAVFITRSITRPIALFVDKFQQGMSGDLTIRVRNLGRDEIGQLGRHFNEFVESLSMIVSKVKHADDSLLTFSEELSESMERTVSAVKQISANVGNIRQEVHQQSHSVNDASTAVGEIVANIDTLSGLIDEQSTSVSESSSAVEEMVANINSVTRAVTKINEYFSQLVSSSDKGRNKINDSNELIKKIAGQSDSLIETNEVISNIAAQTNMLAMNAAIEAAHAGDAGRGFSVVASEIRTLAELSTTQSKEIETKLRSIKELIDQIVRSSRDAEQSFEEVTDLIGTVNELEEQVNNSMIEQSTGSRQVLEMLTQINSVTTNVRTGSQEMREQSKTVLDLMRRLTEISDEVGQSMDEIARGTDEIDVSVNKVTGMSAQNAAFIRAITDEMSAFRLREELEEVGAEPLAGITNAAQPADDVGSQGRGSPVAPDQRGLAEDPTQSDSSGLAVLPDEIETQEGNGSAGRRSSGAVAGAR
jgi:methyl-accepting chemotaxis protein